MLAFSYFLINIKKAKGLYLLLAKCCLELDACIFNPFVDESLLLKFRQPTIERIAFPISKKNCPPSIKSYVDGYYFFETLLTFMVQIKKGLKLKSYETLYCGWSLFWSWTDGLLIRSQKNKLLFKNPFCCIYNNSTNFLSW